MDASKLQPFNIQIMDVNKYIKEHGLMEVKSSFIHESSTHDFDPEGIFSETIFGQVASQERLLRMGYINLNCRVLHPVIFQNLMALKRFYVEIMSGKSYAKWDLENKDFVRASEEDEGANTGYAFFLKHFNQIEFAKNKSLKRSDKINVILKYKDRLFIDKCIVAPAGIRDLQEEGGRIEKDSVNTLYIGLLERAKAMPKGADNDSIYDTIHYSIQRKVLEIYEYLLGFVEGKRGFFESKFGARSIAKGTRNVITSATLECESPESPQYHKQDEVKIPLYQAAKGYDSLVLYWLKSLFYENVIHDGADSIPLIDPDTFTLEYVPIEDKDRDMMLTSEGIMKTIDRFRDPEFRWKSVGATANGKRYILYLVNDENNNITIFRNLAEYKTIYKNKFNKELDMLHVHPLTYAEMLYIATYKASYGKSGTITRYPVTDEQSIFPAKTHLMSTVPGRIVHLIADTNTGAYTMLPEYPVFGKNFVDAVMFHPSKRAGLSADYDGNCLVGSTELQIRYTPLWKEIIADLDYSISNQDVNRVINALNRNTYTHTSSEGFSTIYARVRFDELPQPGVYEIDKNGAHVFNIPSGCEVLTLDNGLPCWRRFDKITVEENCESRRIKVGGRFADVSTNPSVAIFDTETGKLKKVTPVDAVGKFAPVIIKDISPYGKFGTYMDGWFLGSMVSDGYLEEKYLGYTKLDDSTREQVINYLKNVIGSDILYKQYEESPDNGDNKLARSISVHFTDPRVREWANSLEMYDSYERNALTKCISTKYLMNGTRDFLVGLFAGLMDGDGSIVRDKDTGTISFRLSTSSKSLVESVKILAYKLGIRYGVTTYPPRGWSKEAYIVLFNSSDCTGLIDELICFEPGNIEKLGMWRNQRLRTCNDSLPLSESERKSVVAAISNIADKTDLNYFKFQKLEDGFKRYKFHKYLDLIKDQNIVNRVTCWSVHWDKVSLVGDTYRTTVYDLLVPSTKVFAVNNGLIVYDTISWLPLLSEEANEECARYYHNSSNYIFPDGQTEIGTDDLVDLVIHAMTEEPKEK